MKKLFLIIIILFIPKLVYATNIETIDYKSFPLAKEYSEYNKKYPEQANKKALTNSRKGLT